jgi:hypothetical protein
VMQYGQRAGSLVQNCEANVEKIDSDGPSINLLGSVLNSHAKKFTVCYPAHSQADTLIFIQTVFKHFDLAP